MSQDHETEHASEPSEVADEAIEEALRDKDAPRLASLLGLSQRDAEQAVAELQPVPAEQWASLVKAVLDEHGTPKPVSTSDWTSAKERLEPSRRGPRRLGRGLSKVLTPKVGWASGLAVSLSLLVLWIQPQQALPDYALEHGVLHEELTKSPADARGQKVVWRPGSSNVYVELHPLTDTDEKVTAQVFVRTLNRALELELPIRVEGGVVHIEGEATPALIPGQYDLIFAVVKSDDQRTPGEAERWQKGIERPDPGTRLFWFDLSVRPAGL